MGNRDSQANLDNLDNLTLRSNSRLRVESKHSKPTVV